MHTRAYAHLTKTYLKKKDTRESLAFFKHFEKKHGGLKVGEKFEDYFDKIVVEAYKEPLTRNIEEGSFS